MKVAVTGARGMLGEEMVWTLGESHTVVPFPDREELDLKDVQKVRDWVAATRPDAIVHVAAMRDPDPCEEDPDTGWRNNALATLGVVLAARENNAILAHMSSDSVFPGDRNEPYHEFDETGDPISVYGRTKLAAENLVFQHLQRYFVVRLPLLFGRSGGLRKNNIIKMFKNIKEGKAVIAAADSFSSVVYCRDVARAVARMLETELWGTYHVASEPVVSRGGMLREALQAAGKDTTQVTERTNVVIGKVAQRAHYIALTSYLLEPVLGFQMPDWRESMKECVAELQRMGLVD